jgi:hypothetical protein
MQNQTEGITIRLDEKWLRPGTKVRLGPADGRFEGVIYKSHLAEYCDGSHFVEYDVEWWDEKQINRNSFHSSDLEVVCDPE